MIAAAGADAIGINRVAASPRSVSLENARTLASAAHAAGLQVSVVVMNPSLEELADVVRVVAPDVIQLHGQEQPEVIRMCRDCRIVKALSWTGRKEEAALAQAWSKDAARGWLAFLVDAYAPGLGGGTGRVARWDLIKPKPAELGEVPLLLAGGLTANNVARAILETNCEGVDTASGVESMPGVKRKELVEAFVRAAKAAFDQRSTAST